MSANIAIVFWSGTGNTAAMARLIEDAITDQGADVVSVDLSEEEFSSEDLASYDAVAWGCPAMGAEELEDTQFRPVWDECKAALKDLPIALFGSYSWAEGEWMDNWAEEAEAAGLNVVATAICYDQPDEEAEEALTSLAEQLVQSA